MNPFQMIPDMGIGTYVFYNNITKQYYKETNLNIGDYNMMIASPVLEFIGFFKSLIQAQDTIDECIQQDMEYKNRKLKSNKFGGHDNLVVKSPNMSSGRLPLMPIDEDEDIREFYVDDISDLPDIIKMIVDDIAEDYKKPKKIVKNKKKKKEDKI